MTYEIKKINQIYTSNTKELRINAVCTIFRGIIVVFRGDSYQLRIKGFKPVESYNYHVNKWTDLV